MLSYIFKARNSQGALISGDIAADGRQNAVTALKQKGYYLLSVEPQNRLSALINGTHQNTLLSTRISIKQKANFTYQLATLLRAGMQLTTALNTLLLSPLQSNPAA